MKTKIFIAGFLTFCFFNLQLIICQNELKPINYRFEGQEKGFIDLINKNIRYPSESLDKDIVGFSISGLRITPNGKIDSIFILNPIDKFIDLEVIKLLKLSKKYWKKSDTITVNQTFYVQIVFISTGMTQDAKVESPVKKNRFFIDPISVTAFGINPVELPISDDTLIIKSTKLISIGKFEEALPILNELIRRNPFNKNLYQLRILVCRKTKKTELMKDDIQKISNFIQGVSLGELINN